MFYLVGVTIKKIDSGINQPCKTQANRLDEIIVENILEVYLESIQTPKLCFTNKTKCKF